MASYQSLSIHQAAMEGDIAAIEQCLAIGISIDGYDGDGNTPLILATRYRQLATVKLLIDRSADILLADAQSFPPIHIAAANDDTEILRILVEKFPSGATYIEEVRGYSALHAAAAVGALNAMAYLLGNKCVWINVDAPMLNGWTPLFVAAHAGQLEAMEFLLNHNANINIRAEDEISVLHCAVGEDTPSNVDAVIALLSKYGLSLEVLDGLGATPLHIAAMVGADTVIKSLLDRNAAIDAAEVYGETPLHYAGKSGNLKAFKLLLEKGANAFAKDAKGLGVVHIVVAENKDETVVDMIDTLIEYGVSLHQRSEEVTDGIEEGQSILSYAANFNNQCAVRHLLALGADIDEEGEAFSPINSAILGGVECLSLLFNNGSIVPSLHWPATIGEVSPIDILIMNGADVNALNEHQETPLYVAVYEGMAHTVHILLDKGADPNVCVHPPVHVAAAHARIDLIHELVAFGGADINLMSNDGRRALDVAVEKECGAEVITALIKLGADVNAKDPDGCTALHLSVAQHDAEVTKLLLRSNANPKAFDSTGMTPLHRLASSHCPASYNESDNEGAIFEIVAALVASGANVNEMDNQGEHDTPLHCGAAKSSNTVVVKALLSFGADIEAIGAEGMTPLLYAVQSNSEVTVNLLLDKKANPNAVCGHSLTALHYCATLDTRYDILSMVNCLVGHGAELNADTFANGTSPLHFAAISNNVPAMKAMIAAGAHVNALTTNNYTPLQCAKAQNNTEAITYLESLNLNSKISIPNVQDLKDLHPDHWVPRTQVTVAKVLDER